MVGACVFRALLVAFTLVSSIRAENNPEDFFSVIRFPSGQTHGAFRLADSPWFVGLYDSNPAHCEASPPFCLIDEFQVCTTRYRPPVAYYGAKRTNDTDFRPGFQLVPQIEEFLSVGKDLTLLYRVKSDPRLHKSRVHVPAAAPPVRSTTIGSRSWDMSPVEGKFIENSNGVPEAGVLCADPSCKTICGILLIPSTSKIIQLQLLDQTALQLSTTADACNYLDDCSDECNYPPEESSQKQILFGIFVFAMLGLLWRSRLKISRLVRWYVKYATAWLLVAVFVLGVYLSCQVNPIWALVGAPVGQALIGAVVLLLIALARLVCCFGSWGHIWSSVAWKISTSLFPWNPEDYRKSVLVVGAFTRCEEGHYELFDWSSGVAIGPRRLVTTNHLERNDCTLLVAEIDHLDGPNSAQWKYVAREVSRHQMGDSLLLEIESILQFPVRSASVTVDHPAPTSDEYLPVSLDLPPTRALQNFNNIVHHLPFALARLCGPCLTYADVEETIADTEYSLVGFGTRTTTKLPDGRESHYPTTQLVSGGGARCALQFVPTAETDKRLEIPIKGQPNLETNSSTIPRRTRMIVIEGVAFEGSSGGGVFREVDVPGIAHSHKAKALAGIINSVTLAPPARVVFVAPISEVLKEVCSAQPRVPKSKQD